MSDNLFSILRNYFSSQPVKRAWVFGSVARGEAVAESDIDILVDFDEGVSLMKYSSMIGDLERLLHKAIDLVSNTALLPWIKPSVDEDKILIYEDRDCLQH